MKKQFDDDKGSDGKAQIQKSNDFDKINIIDGIISIEAECVMIEAEFLHFERTRYRTN